MTRKKVLREETSKNLTTLVNQSTPLNSQATKILCVGEGINSLSTKSSKCSIITELHILNANGNDRMK